ncbi:hypothetical protein EV363DRAFT_1301496 [Boletus edulis]|nr:hypothetical protein EV363DRAFT_1301496 [Boletus edulis]
MPSTPSHQEELAIGRKEPGHSWRQDEEHVLPKNRLGIVSFAFVCTMFLGALDQTIVATALPTIVARLQGGNSYSWVGSAYMLAAGTFSPHYGKLSNMFGRISALRRRTKHDLADRLQSGPGDSRGRYGGLAGATYGLLLFIFLNVHPPPKLPLRDQIAELDFIGLFSLIAGVACLLLGLNFGQESWLEPRTIGMLVAGATVLVVGGVHQALTKRVAILPPRLFKQLHFFNTPLTFRQYFLGASATGAGYILMTSASCIISGFVVSKKSPIDLVRDVEKEVLPLVAAISAGCVFQVPMVVLQAAMHLKDMATATNALVFLCVLGGGVGLAISEEIIASVLPRKLAAIPNFASLGLGDNIAVLNDNIVENTSTERSFVHMVV